MARPRKYNTEAERLAAKREADRRYNAKRYQPIADANNIAGLVVKQGKKNTTYIYKGKTISATRLAKILPVVKEAEANRKASIKEIATNRKQHLVRGKRTTQQLREAHSIYENRINGAKLAVQRLAEGASGGMFTEAQVNKMIRLSELFSKAAPQGDRANFWEIYDEVAKKFKDTEPGRFGRLTSPENIKLAEMFEAQLGANFTMENLPFLYE